jgi:SAM-dependent methyltransferase
MSGSDFDMNTDEAWEEWGRRDPYFGVITDPKYRRSVIKEVDKREFFESGHWHVSYVMRTIHEHIDRDFNPRSVLDFGCGVGRTLVSFAQIAHKAVGLDVSVSMLDEARRNCQERDLKNVQLALSDDALSSLTEPVDLIHSCIVFQHIAPNRGRLIFRNLLKHLAPRGIGAFHLLYSKSRYADTHGTAPPTTLQIAASTPRPSGADPEIQMNPYNLNEILFLMQSAGARRFYTDFTDHGGELGVFLFFQKD